MRDRKRYLKEYYRKHKKVILARNKAWSRNQMANGLTYKGKPRKTREEISKAHQKPYECPHCGKFLNE